MIKQKKHRRLPQPQHAIKEGFYIEVRNRTSTEKGIKLFSDTLKEMEESVRHYRRMKHVIVLGEYRNKKWLSKPMAVAES